jgi:hypothetical protein
MSGSFDSTGNVEESGSSTAAKLRPQNGRPESGFMNFFVLLVTGPGRLEHGAEALNQFILQ